MGWSLKGYYRPRTEWQALRLIRRFEPHAAALAGGTRLVAERNPTINILVDLSALKLDYIEIRRRRVYIGALTRLQSIARHPQLKALAGGLLAQAAQSNAPLPIRNLATLGGTLAVSEATSELALALLVLEAQVVLRTSDRSVVSLADFLARREEYLFAPGLIIETRVTLPQAGSGVALADVRLTQGDRPIVNAAALVYRKGNILQSARLAVGGVTPVPIRLPELETRLAGDYLEEATLERVSLEIESSLNPPSDRRTSAEYRRAMAGITVARALRQAWERAKKE